MLASVIAPDKTAMLVNMGFLIFRLPYHVPSSHAIDSLKAEKPFSGCLNPIPTMQTKMSKMNFTVKPFPELTTAELHAIYTARVAVFVVEQACSYQEVDRLLPPDSARRQRAFGARVGAARASRRKTGAQNRRLCHGLRPRPFPAMQRVRPSANLSARFLRLVWLYRPIRIVFGRQHSAYGYAIARRAIIAMKQKLQ